MQPWWAEDTFLFLKIIQEKSYSPKLMNNRVYIEEYNEGKMCIINNYTDKKFLKLLFNNKV